MHEGGRCRKVCEYCMHLKPGNKKKLQVTAPGTQKYPSDKPSVVVEKGAAESSPAAMRELAPCCMLQSCLQRQRDQAVQASPKQRSKAVQAADVSNLK